MEYLDLKESWSVVCKLLGGWQLKLCLKLGMVVFGFGSGIGISGVVGAMNFLIYHFLAVGKRH